VLAAGLLAVITSIRSPYDGKHHAVDSRKSLYNLETYLDAVMKARPFLEPIVNIEITAPKLPWVISPVII
jgi:hypothetical protein